MHIYLSNDVEKFEEIILHIQLFLFINIDPPKLYTPDESKKSKKKSVGR